MCTARCACAALSIEPPRLLDYQDRWLSEIDPEAIVAEILTVMDEVHPQIMLTFGPDGISGHPGHIAIGQCAAEAFRRSENVTALYTLAAPQLLAEKLGMSQIQAAPEEAVTLAVDISETWEAKLAAIRCRATQLSSSPITSAPLKRQRLFLGREYFVRAAARGRNDILAELEAK